MMEQVAICGMACRLPGASNSPSALWELIKQKRTAITRIPATRFNIDGFYSPVEGRPGSIKSEYGSFIDANLEEFDCGAFEISPYDAQSLDPQTRLLLECAWECFESAGAPLESISSPANRVGCYVGSSASDYADLNGKDAEYMHAYSLTGSGRAMLSNRISYAFDLHGPSFTIDTGCSASMVAFHTACRAITTGECSSALVGGANLYLLPDLFMSNFASQIISCTGTSHSFDAAANGYGRGEGVSCIYLKALGAAVADGDPIRAVIRATACNSDGKTVGISLPNGAAHELVIREAYRAADLPLNDTVLVECHGTGTPVGDPIETEVVGKVFGASRKGKDVFINSIKANIGHSEAASGLSSVIKLVQALEHGVVPPQANFNTPNPNIKFTDWNLQVPLVPLPWPAGEVKRASLNNWGYGGTNVHVIIDEAPAQLTQKKFILERDHPMNSESVPTDLTDRPFLIPFSAHDKVALARFVERVKNIPGIISGNDLLDIAHTLARRSALFCRAFVTARANSSSLSELITDEGLVQGERKSGVLSIGFIFTGQGAQWPQMGGELLDFASATRDLEKMQNALDRLPNAPDWKLKDEIMLPAATSKVHEASRSQPLCTAIQILLVNVLRSWGVKPTAVAGHSSGEIAAAYAAGVITMQEAIVVAYLRGKHVTDEVPDGYGAMMSVGLSPEEASTYLDCDICIACYNSPKNVTLSGPRAKLIKLENNLKTKSVFARLLKTGYAYHSKHIGKAGDPYSKSMAGRIKRQHGQVAIYSSVSGLTAGSTYGSERYWRENLDSPVRFTDAITSMLRSGSVQHLVEIGPHGALAGPIRQIRDALDISETRVPYTCTLERKKCALDALLACAGRLWLAGCKVDFDEVNCVGSRSDGTLSKGTLIVDFPTYSWNKTQRCWYERRSAQEWRHRKNARHDLIGSRLPGGHGAEVQWRNMLRPKEVQWLAQHKLHDVPVLPAAGHMAMALEGLAQLLGDDGICPTGFRIRDFGIRNVLFVPEDGEGTEVFLSIRKHALHTFADSEKWWRFSVWTCCEKQWTEHSMGLIALESEREFDDLPNFAGEWRRSLNVNRWYHQMALRGLDFGDQFRGFGKLEYHAPSRTFTATGNARITYDSMPHQSYYLHPTTIGLCLQTIMSSFYLAPPHFNHILVPVFIEEAFFMHPQNQTEEFDIVARSDTPGRHRASGDVQAFDSRTGQLLLDIRGISWKAMEEDPAALALCSTKTDPLRAPYWRSVWKPDLDCVGTVHRPLFVRDELDFSQPVRDMERLAALWATEMLDRLERIGEPLRDYHHHYVSWLQFAASHPSARPVPADDRKRAEEIDELLRRLKGNSLDVDLMSRVFQNFEALMTAVVEPIEALIGEDDLLSRFYSEHLGLKAINPVLCEVTNLLVHKNPGMKILEIGAGTGGTTSAVMDSLWGGKENEQMFSEYLFTDISPGFFENARQRFGHSGIQCKVLDIETPVVDQGFEEGTYDLIFAANVLHATKTMKNTMTNVRKLLKPGGKLVMVEQTNQVLRATFIMGILPGWWLGIDEGRTRAPTITAKAWSSLLAETGFSGIDLQIDDSASKDGQVYSVIVSTAVEQKMPKGVHEDQGICVIYREMTDHTRGVIAELEETHRITAYAITEKITPHDARVVFLAEMTSPLLSNIRSEEWDGLKHIVSRASSMLWVTSGAQLDVSSPESAMVNGLARSIRTETGGALELYTLDLDPKRLAPTLAGPTILQSLERMKFDESHDAPREYEVAERDGIMYLNRLVPDNHFESEMATLLNTSFNEAHPAWKPRDIGGWTLDLQRPGELDTLGFMEDDQHVATLPDDFVEIQVEVAGLGWPDALTSMGFTTHDDFTFGRECAGVVSKLGQHVSHLKIGDRVCALGEGALRSHYRTHHQRCVKIPENITSQDAAGSLLNFSTVIHSLRDVVKLARHQSVLIHSAAGGIGLAAVQYCKHVGSEIFATVSTDEKKTYLNKEYGIPLENIFNSRNSSFYQGIMRRTNREGVDVILSSMSGDLLHHAWRCLKKFGCLVDLRALDARDGGTLDMRQFLGHRIFHSFDILNYAELRPLECARLMEEVLGLFSEGVLRPMKETKVFPVNEIRGAFRYLQSGKHIGKAVVALGEKISPNLFHPGRKSWSMTGGGTILMVGGLGGLGRSCSAFIAEHGAKHITFVSRGGAKPEDAQFLKYLEDLGCKIHVAKGDICVRTDVERIVNEVGLPVIGVIQGAMVLEDQLFAGMTVDSFRRVVSSKVHGTINLHEVLMDQPLQFFILLSSASGIIGNQGQASYSAGNMFLDCFARHRKQHGLPVTLIDLSMVYDVGYVAQHPEVEAAIRAQGYVGVQEREMLSLVQLSIQKRTDADFSLQGADRLASVGLVTGLNAPKLESGTVLLGDRALWVKDGRFAIPMAIANRANVGTASAQEISSDDEEIQSVLQAFGALKDPEPAEKLSETQIIDIVGRGILAKISIILGSPLDSLSAEKSPASYGLDSLVAVELRAWIRKTILVDIEVHRILVAQSIRELATLIHEEKFGKSK